ncbi:MAG: MBOAT family protein [Bacilli bacterium]|nr:MBOAT family protein [Bacilli bacterium]
MFHQIMYILDVRNKKMGVEKNLFSYLTYITCFPYVTMGPLISYSDIKKQLEDLSFSLDSFYSGLKRFLFGFSKKVLLADNLGILYQQVYSINHVSVSSCVFSLIVFALQLYLDFSSYTDMAIGIGKMLHLSLPENFDHPYLATNVSDFWRRWHMTLTSFLKNYVYIPLGGNRVSSLRHIFNLLVVWVLTGIWHGTTFNFLLWGLYYFFILLFEKYFLLKYLEKFPKIIQHFYTLILVLFGYSLFCITSPKELFTFYDHLFHSPICNSNLLFYLKENIILLLISIILCTRIPYFLIQKDTDCLAVSVINDLFLILLFFLSITYLLSGSYSPFLYNAF